MSPLKAAVSSAANPAATLQVATHAWMAALDRKDMIFMVPFQEDNKEKFAFTWEGVQCTFSRLPWGYKHSPTIAHAVLAELVELLQTVSLPQMQNYVNIDDIVIAGDSPEKMGKHQ